MGKQLAPVGFRKSIVYFCISGALINAPVVNFATFPLIRRAKSHLLEAEQCIASDENGEYQTLPPWFFKLMRFFFKITPPAAVIITVLYSAMFFYLYNELN
jgi:hypothetical protein